MKLQLLIIKLTCSRVMSLTDYCLTFGLFGKWLSSQSYSWDHLSRFTNENEQTVAASWMATSLWSHAYYVTVSVEC